MPPFHTSRDAIIIAVYLIAAPLTGLVAVRILVARARQRTRAFRAAAACIGFAFEGDTWQNKCRAPLLETALFGRGNRHSLRNILSGERDGLGISVFDYKFVEGGRGGRHYSQTVSTFSRDDVCLPDFELRPAQILDKTLSALTHKSINFVFAPEFARRYALTSPVEDKVRAVFTRGLIAFLDNLDVRRKWHIEGTGNTLVVYQFRKRIPPEDIPAFLGETLSLARGFFDSLGA